MTSSAVWHNVHDEIEVAKSGYIVFDDTVADKNFSQQIELVRRQYSGNAHGIIKGIGIVNCVYVNPETEQFWVIDFRFFAVSTYRTDFIVTNDLTKNSTLGTQKVCDYRLEN